MAKLLTIWVPGLRNPIRIQDQYLPRVAEQDVVFVERYFGIDAKGRSIPVQIGNGSRLWVHEQRRLMAGTHPGHRVTPNLDQVEGHEPLDVAQVGDQKPVYVGHDLADPPGREARMRRQARAAVMRRAAAGPWPATSPTAAPKPRPAKSSPLKKSR